MKILHIVPSYIPAWRYGGPIRSVHGLCKALAARGIDMHVATTNVDGLGNSDVLLGTPVDLDGVSVRYFPSKHLRRLFWAPEMKEYFQREIAAFDLVHLHSVFLWPTLAAARTARRAGVPYIVSPRGMLVKDLVERKSSFVKNAWLRLFERQTLESAAALHVTSCIEAEEARKFGYRLPPFITIPNGVELPGCEREKVTSEKGKVKSEMLIHPSPFTLHRDYLLFLGRVNWKKGLDRLVQAMKHVRKDARLIIAGNDEENYQTVLEAMAREHGVAERIDFVGSVSGERKAELLAGACALVLPSYSENFGLVVLEAMAHATPVVVTPEVGAAEIVREANGGVVIDGDPEKLGRALDEMLSDPVAGREMGERGRRLVMDNYSWDAIAVRMEEAYRKVITNG